MLDRYDVNICDCALGVHTEAVKSDSGDWIKYEDVENVLLNLYKQCISGFVYPSQIPNDEKLKANIEKFLKTNRLN